MSIVESEDSYFNNTIIDGFAVDSLSTRYAQQLLSFQENASSGLACFHYTLPHRYLGKKTKKLLPKNLEQLASCDTPDKHGILHQGMGRYVEFVEKLSHNSDDTGGFERGVETPGITFSFIFDSRTYDLKKTSVRLTDAVLHYRASYGDAPYALQQGGHEDFDSWIKFMNHHSTLEGLQGPNVNFQALQEQTSYFVHEAARDLALSDKRAAILHGNKIVLCNNRLIPGNGSRYTSTARVAECGANASLYRMPLTNGTDEASLINSAMLGYYLLNGEDYLSHQETAALALLCNHHKLPVAESKPRKKGGLMPVNPYNA